MTKQANVHVPLLVSAGENGKLQELYDPEKSTWLFKTHGQIGQVLSKIHTPKRRRVRLYQKYAYTTREAGKRAALQPFNDDGWEQEEESAGRCWVYIVPCCEWWLRCRSRPCRGYSMSGETLGKLTNLTETLHRGY